MNDDGRRVDSVSVELADGMHFAGDIDGLRINLDAEEGVGGQGAGAQPLRLLLLGTAGCTAMDVISIPMDAAPRRWVT
jgi:putative redox protein